MTTAMTGPAQQGDHAGAGGDFGAQLDSLVRHHIGNLTAQHAVDEANGDVLDALIDSAVEGQQESIDARAIRRRESLRRELTGLRADHATATATEAEVLGRVRALAAKVLSLRSRVAGNGRAEGVDESETYSVFEVRRLRGFVAERRRVLERDAGESLKAAGVRSSSRLLVKRDAAVRRAEPARRRLQVSEQKHDAAVAELAVALAKFRGQPPALPVASSLPVAPSLPVAASLPVTASRTAAQETADGAA